MGLSKNSNFPANFERLDFVVRSKPAANIGFCASWVDVITMSICKAVQLLFGLDVYR